jgi:hypothetical protein
LRELPISLTDVEETSEPVAATGPLNDVVRAGNYCVGGEQGREPGNGRIVVAEYNDKKGDECGWEVLKTVDIPDAAYFTDYSGMAFRGDKV